jgi:transposase-like protein
MIKKEQATQYYPAKYKTKLEAVLDMLKGGQTVKQIKSRILVSDSYIYLAKKQLKKAAGVLELTKDQIVTEKPTPPDKPSVNDILNERATTYGHFYMQAELSQALKNTIMAHLIEAKKTLVADQQEALEMILTKIARITNGNSNHVDSWDDIAGYATLVAKRLRGKLR